LYARHGSDKVSLYAHTWQKTTQFNLKKKVKLFTHLRTLYPLGNDSSMHIQAAVTMKNKFPDEILTQLEFGRFERGRIGCIGLPLVKFTSKERLQEIITCHEENGIKVFDPNCFTLEDRGIKTHEKVRMKKVFDPKGLLNPGKMRRWHEKIPVDV